MRSVALAALLFGCLGARAEEPPPFFPWRGVLEGFYGRPWSWEERRHMVAWMASRGMNLFVLAPKDDDALRREWRRPLRRGELEGLLSLQREARTRSVELAWALSPLGARLDDPEEAKAAVRKYESVLALGIRKLVLAFDDMEPDPDQIAFANRVLGDVLERHPDAEMTFVPAQYWGLAAPSPYLDRVALRLDPRFRVGWTGDRIISRAIRAGEAGRFRAYIRHPLVLGDNYPVQDRLEDSGRLFLGPLIGREAGLARRHDAVVFNASPLPEASKIPLYTEAEYARDPDHYDPEKAWRAAFSGIGGSQGARWVELLARECAGSWLSVPTPEFLRSPLSGAIEAYWRTRDARPLEKLLAEFEGLPEGLKAGLAANPELYRELEPWARKLASQAQAALLALRALGRKQGSDGDLDRLVGRAEENPAIVADLALDRFLARARAVLQGGYVPGDRPLSELLPAYCRGSEKPASVAEALDSLRRAPALVPGDAAELVPWLGILAKSAQPRRGPLWRWRLRLSLVPLDVSRRILERHLALAQARWNLPVGAPRGLPLPLKVWLRVQAWREPSSFPVLLDRAVERYRLTGDGGELADRLRFLAELPRRTRMALGGRFPPEIGPWLDKVGEYGVLGLESLAADPPRDWDRSRARLRSANGLELCLELKLLLDAFARWERSGGRPEALDPELPPDPANLI